MSKLQTALRSGEESLESLTAQYAVKVKPHPLFPNLVQLKYNQIDSPMGNELVQECRGPILDTANNFEYVARPFTKFFNHQEGHAKPIHWPSAKVQEKLDGSLMIVYFYAGGWHVASSGTPDAGGEVNNANGTTFKELFWRTFQDVGYVTNQMDPARTYMFELMTKYNRVVVQHAEPRLVLIGIRENSSGMEFPLFHGPQFQAVREFPLGSLEDVEASMAHFSGLEQEGYVVVDGNFNRVKIKHPAYLAAHHMVGSLSPKRLLEIVRQGETPEILAYFPEWTEEANALRIKYEDLVTEACIEYQKVKDIPVQKDFALTIKDSRHKSAMFTLRAKKIETIGQYYRELRIDALADMLGLKEKTDEQEQVQA